MLAALRKARRQEQLVSKRLLREDSAAQDGADVPDPLSEDEVKNLMFSVAVGVPGAFPRLSTKEVGQGWVWEWFRFTARHS